MIVSQLDCTKGVCEAMSNIMIVIIRRSIRVPAKITDPYVSIENKNMPRKESSHLDGRLFLKEQKPPNILHNEAL